MKPSSNTPKTRKTPWEFLLLAALSLLAARAPADTVGYWRFDDAPGFLNDASGNGLTLSTAGTAPVQFTLPATGPGAAFDRTIPQTGQANAKGVYIPNAAGNFTRADNALFAFTSFTIEAYVDRTNAPSGTTYIASQWASSAGARAWSFGVAGTSPPTGLAAGELFLLLSADGTVQNILGSGLVLALNTDYYVAASVDTANAASGVTFYLKNLSTGGSLTNATKGSPVATLCNSTTTFAIASYNSGASRWPGVIDEVRLSNQALAAGQLLCNANTTPVPAAIDTPPQSQAVALHGNATFTVGASGTPPLSYQWRLGTALLSGQTNQTLVLTNVGLSQAGNQYSVIVTNAYGSVTSAPALILAVVDTSSATIGYWRFENPADLGQDSSGNGLEITNAGAPASLALPDPLSGLAGALFPHSIPLTGQANTAALQLDGSSSYLAHSDWPSFTLGTQMTIEAFFNAAYVSPGATMPIAGQWEGNQVSWIFGVREKTAGAGDLQLRFGLSATGTATAGPNEWITNADRWILSTGKDYYAAVVFDTGTVTFYLADLSSANPILQSETFTTVVTNFYDTPVDFRLGAYLGSGGMVYFPGLLDEVRLSRVALPASALLVPPPAPPYISVPPHDVAVGQFSDATFTVTALGAQPLSYQWYSGTAPLASATNATLVLTNVAPSQSGSSYYVVVTNVSGSVTSAPGVLTVVDTSSATVGYWRFENPADLGQDSSGNGLEFSPAGAPASLTLPDPLSGLSGALFPHSIALTGQANTAALQLDGSSAYLAHGDWPSFTLGKQMTIEAFFNAAYASPSATLPIAGQYDASQASWIFGVRSDSAGQTMQLRFGVSSTGTTTAGPSYWITSADRWTLSPGKDYYAAVVFDAGTVTFYLADLSSTNPTLQGETFTTVVTNFFDSPGDFRLGAYLGSGGLIYFPGLLDEVRLSRVALPYWSLLYPPPSQPVIVTPPQGVVATQFSDATFTVTATGLPPLRYQWYAGATPLAGATDSTLVLTKVTLGQSGSQYSVIVTNAYGSATSAPALLTVVNLLGPTVGYWRFENAADLGRDFSGNGGELTPAGTPGSLTLPNPFSGSPGALFPRTLLQTGETNTTALQLDGASYLTGADSLAFTLTNFTIEAYVDRTGALPANETYIVAQFQSSGNQRSWGFGVAGSTPPSGSTISGPILSSGELFLVLDSGGQAFEAIVGSGLILEPNTDYYVAASLDLTKAAGGVSFYFQNLSTNGLLTTSVRTNPVAALFNSTAPFMIGAYDAGTNCWPGVIDEVRLSRVVLSPDQLLASRYVQSLPSHIAGIRLQSSSIQLSATGVGGSSYSVLRSTNLASPTAWQVIGSNVLAAPNGSLLFTDPNPPASAGFYRFRQP